MAENDYIEQLSMRGKWSPNLRKKYVHENNEKVKDKFVVKESEQPSKPVCSNEEEFIQAAAEGNLKLQLNLISKVSINTQNSKGHTALISACMRGHPSSVQFLLAKQASRQMYDETGNSAYHYACMRDDPVILKLLMAKGDGNFKNRDGQTVLHLAVKNDRYKVLDLLLNSEKVNINEKDDDENTAVHLAVMEGNTKVLMKLIRAPVNLALFNKNGLNPINLAIHQNDIECMKILLNTKEGIKILTYKTQFKESNLQIAIRLKFSNIVEYLMSIKNVNLINSDVDDKYGYTCLHWATLQINKGLVDKILNANQKIINVKDRMEMTALEHIVNLYEKSKTPQSDIIAIATSLFIHDADPFLVTNRSGLQKLIKEICLKYHK